MLTFRAICLSVLFCLTQAWPQVSFATRHSRDVAANPADLHFEVTTAGDQRKFRIGERISLTLAFSSDSVDKYKLNGATYDRSGRLPTEEFMLERADVADPYADYFGASVLGGLAGGIRGYPVLQSKPYVIQLDLNEWFRFDLPGVYRFYLKSHRLTRESAPGESDRRTVEFAAVSNIVSIEILAKDPGWEAAKLEKLRAILEQPEPERPKPGGPPVPYDPMGEKIAMARRELRYLETPGAVRLAFDLSRRNGESPDTLMLVGARDRLDMLSAFDSYLADPAVSFGEWDIRLRAFFRYLESEKPRRLPIFVWEWPQDQAEREKTWNEVTSRQGEFEEFVRKEALRLIAIAGSKGKTARKISGEAIAAIAPDAARAARLVPPDDYGLSREGLIKQLPDFPPDQQSALLGEKWDLIRGPDAIPALREVISKAKVDPPASSTGLNVWGVDGGVGETALRRLSELSPEAAAGVLVADIASGAPRFARFAVREFPARNIPEADDALAKLLETDPDTALPLISKFATSRLTGEMRQWYWSQSWACQEEEWFVSYLVRVHPGEQGEGQAMLRRAMSEREDRGCYQWLLGRVAAVAWDSGIQAQVLASLNDPNPEVTMEAARVLAAHGGPEVEPFLWKKLELWSQRWRGRAAELRVNPITGAGRAEENRVGEALFEVIASAKAWWLDEPRRKRLMELCVDDWCTQRWKPKRLESPFMIDVSNGGSLYPAAFRVDGYTEPTLEALKAKVAQFPAGSQFRWCPQADSPFDFFSPGQREDMFKEIKGYLSTRSMAIEPYDAKKCGR